MDVRRVKRLVKRVRLRDVIVFGAGAAIALVGIGLASATEEPKPLSPEVSTITSPWVPESVKRWRGTVETMAQRYNIDPNLIAIIMTMESGGYSRADSGQAQGLMQITPATAKDIARRYIRQPTDKYDIWKPETNIEFGAAYLAKLRDLYSPADSNESWIATVELVAAAYNGGFGAANALEKGEGINDPQTIIYSRDAFNMWRERHADRSPTFERWKERGGSKLIDQAQAEMKR